MAKKSSFIRKVSALKERMDGPAEAKKPSTASCMFYAMKMITENGPIDGAHHKDWVLQQALKILMAWNDEQLKEALKRMNWEPGIRP